MNNANQGFCPATRRTRPAPATPSGWGCDYTARVTGDNLSDKNAWSTAGASLLGVTFPRTYKFRSPRGFDRPRHAPLILPRGSAALLSLGAALCPAPSPAPRTPPPGGALNVYPDREPSDVNVQLELMQHEVYAQQVDTAMLLLSCSTAAR